MTQTATHHKVIWDKENYSSDRQKQLSCYAGATSRGYTSAARGIRIFSVYTFKAGDVHGRMRYSGGWWNASINVVGKITKELAAVHGRFGAETRDALTNLITVRAERGEFELPHLISEARNRCEAELADLDSKRKTIEAQLLRLEDQQPTEETDQ